MRTILHAAALVATLALAGPATARDAQARLPASAAVPVDEDLLFAFGEANDHIQRQEYVQAYAVLEAVTAKPAFQSATSELRHATWLLMAISYQPILRFYRRSPFWGLALPLIALVYMAFTLDSAYQHLRGRGGLWKGRVQAQLGKVAEQK